MNTENDWLEQALRQNDPHIEDGGFTDSVLQHLPKARLRKPWLQAWILLFAATIPSVLTAYLLPADLILVNQLLDLWFSQSLPMILGILGLLSLTVSAAAWLIADM
jgi:hypothetical protein